MRIAKEVRRADGLPVSFDFKRQRASDDWSRLTIIGWHEDEFSGIKLDPFRDPDHRVIFSRVTNAWGLMEDLTQAAYAPLKPGPQTYHYRYHVCFYGNLPLDKLTGVKPLGERVIEDTLHWTLLADDQRPALPSLKRDEALRPAVEKCFSIIRALRDTRDTSLVDLMIQVDRPPVGMAFNVSLRAGNHEQLFVGPVAWFDGGNLVGL